MNVKPDISQLIDIYDPWYRPWWHSYYALAVLYICAAICCGAFLWYLWKKYIKNRSLSYEQKALLELQSLHERTYHTDADIRDAYFKMTHILKQYLSRRYHISLLEKTDTQFIDEAKTIFHEEMFMDLKQLFEKIHAIKFAHAEISLKELYNDIDFMQHIIYQTIKQGTGSGDF